MARATVAVLFGGCSTEYGVSLQSAYSVIENLDGATYEVIPIGITRSGDWFRYDGPSERLLDDSWAQADCVPAVISPSRETHGIVEFHRDKTAATRLDVAFPVLHGKNGEDGTVQGLLALAGVPCVGCGTLSSAICMDKDIAHTLAQAAGVAVPRSIILDKQMPSTAYAELVADLKGALFVKPVCAGSSFGIAKVSDRAELVDAVEAAFRHDGRVMIEEEIRGFEVGCAVMGNEDLTIGAVDEIELAGGFFDYEEKYTLKSSRIHVPARIDEATATRVKETAALLYRTLRCTGLARVDLFLTPENEIVFNEVNTIPGFTLHSRYPSMMKEVGIAFPQLLDRLIREAMSA